MPLIPFLTFMALTNKRALSIKAASKTISFSDFKRIVTGANCPCGKRSCKSSKPCRDEMSLGNDFIKLNEYFMLNVEREGIINTINKRMVVKAGFFIIKALTFAQNP